MSKYAFLFLDDGVDYQAAADFRPAHREGRRSGDAARQRGRRQLVRGDSQRQRAPLERREAPVTEFDEESPQEEAARLLAGAIVLEPAEHGDADAVRGEQDGGEGGEDQDQVQPPNGCPAWDAAERLVMLITVQALPAGAPARPAGKRGPQVSDLHQFCKIASLGPARVRCAHTSPSGRQDEEDHG